MTSPCKIVTFTTDFGMNDTFVGEMKGAALSIRPDLVLVDITHEVPPHDIHAGAFMLECSYSAFPAGTVHVAVVDPGVGTVRRALALEGDSHFFIAPDNGLLSRIIRRVKVTAMHAIDKTIFRPGGISATFEGRDLFAPVAARLASGTPLSEIGPAAQDPILLDLSRQIPAPDSPARVRILLVDRFGNATLDLPVALLENFIRGPVAGAGLRIDTPGGTVTECHRTYADSDGISPFVLVNSAGYLEIAIRERNAAEILGLNVGDTVVCSIS